VKITTTNISQSFFTNEKSSLNPTVVLRFSKTPFARSPRLIIKFMNAVVDREGGSIFVMGVKLYIYKKKIFSTQNNDDAYVNRTISQQ